MNMPILGIGFEKLTQTKNVSTNGFIKLIPHFG